MNGATALRAGSLPSPAILLGLIAACMMLQPLSTDLYLASLPHLAAYFHASTAAAQLTLSGFVIAFGAAQLVVGPLSDRYGRRPVLLAGFGVYLAATVACAFAPTMALLIAGRFVQALGACSAVLIARALVRDIYPPAEGARVLAQASSLLAIAPILGPILGGYLQVAFGWRAAFVALTIFAMLLCLAVWRMLGETNLHKDPRALVPSGLIANYAFILRSPTFWAYAAPGSLSYGSIFVFISGSSPVLIRVLGVPTQYYGYCFAFGVLGYLAGTIVCRRLMRRFGVERTLGMGALGSAAAGVLFALLVFAGLAHWATVVGAQFLVMFAHGINFPCVQTGAVAPFPRQAGAAAGLLGFLMMTLAFALGTWMGASFDGTVVPLAATSAGVGIALAASARSLARYRTLGG
ncbi:MAG: Bcr/CflA family multidrug efflux MFS transporter [Rhodocyclaceae bacterium]